MKPGQAKVLMVSSVHRWNDVRVYHKETLSLAKFADVHLVAVQTPEKPKMPADGISIEFLPANNHTRPGETKSLSQRFLHIGMVLKAALRQKYDVFHFHDPELIPVGWLAKMRGKKVIYDMHEDALHLLTRRRWIPKPLAGIGGMIFRGLEKLSLRIFDRFILAEKAYAEVFTAEKCCTVLNYPKIDQTFRPTKRPANEPLRLVYMGSIVRARGAEDILKGVRELRKSGLNITLDLYGTISEVKSHEMIIRGQSEGWLKYHGWIPGDILPSRIRRYHVGLSPLRDNPGYLHIWPTKVLEYVASGLAVIATSLPGMKCLMKEIECGVLYAPNDVTAFKEAVLTLYDEDARILLAEKGYHKVSEYSWASQEGALLNLYRDMLN